ncbi:hypothetical protein Tco_1015237 [Tanacetum coccineum]|uniref:Uncharacterized protein n=1 Tax=Tanacetum coccineum TaxID=301880 RepID=A0ABQ5FMN4_9ASTR
MAPLLPREQRHRFLRYEGLEYTDLDIADFEMAMEHRDEAGVVVFTSQAWRRLFETRGPLVWELILEFLSTLKFGEVLLDLDAPDTIQRFTIGRKSGAHISSRRFVGRLAQHFGLLTTEILRGLTVVAPELQMIDMVELVRLLIYVQLDDTWAWVAMGPERQPDAAAGAPANAEDALIFDEGVQADPAPMLAP